MEFPRLRAAVAQLDRVPGLFVVQDASRNDEERNAAIGFTCGGRLLKGHLERHGTGRGTWYALPMSSNATGRLADINFAVEVH